MMSENKLQSLSEIFNEKFFRIPDFQRGYAWEEGQLKDFWEDLELLNENNTHYTGVLSVKPVDKSQVVAYDTWQDDIWLLDGGFKAYYLIDGQQRLTTSIILINEILKKVKSDEFLMKSKNISISNEPFEYKKKYANAKGVLNGYFNGSYSELEVAEYDNWTIDEIHDRGVKMLKFIEERWNINLEEEGFDIERILGINVAVNDKKRVSSLPDFSEELDDCEEEE